jgi:hypothetical protein
MEDIDWRASRGLDRHLVTALAGGDWIRHGRNVLVTGATGCGKTWLGCALAQQAARQGFSVLYTRATRLLQELQVAHGDGSFSRRLAQLARLDLSGARRPGHRADHRAGAPGPAGAAGRPGGQPKHAHHQPVAHQRLARSGWPSPPSPTPSWTGCCTARTPSRSRASPCAGPRPKA